MDLEKDGVDLARAFSKLVNSSNRIAKKRAMEDMLREHPTLQQGMVRFFMEFMDELAEQNGDLRNEGSRKLAKEIKKIPRCLPLI